MTLTGKFRAPFSEQVAAFRLRLANLQPTATWEDVWQEQHDRAFMVAGAMKADLLADLAAAVDSAVTKGTTLEEFRADFRAIVERNGWHGWTGEGTKGGEAWRTKVIYKTNLATTYAAGRWAQIKAAGYPLIVYRHGGSLDPRIQHLGWNGLILPADHPFWATHAPPNGWGCSCYITGARSEKGAVRVGGKPGKQLPDGWDAALPKTGAPPGIDRGWAYAPGATVADQIGQLAQKPPLWEFDLAKGFMASLPPETQDALAKAYRRLPSVATELQRIARAGLQPGEVQPLPAKTTLGLLGHSDARLVRSLTGVEADGFDWAIEPWSFLHVRKRHTNPKIEASRGQRAVTPEDFGLLPLILNDPDEVSFVGTNTASSPVVQYQKRIGTETFVALFEVRRSRRHLILASLWVKV